MATTSEKNRYIAAGIVALAVIAVIVILMQPEQEAISARLGNAANEMSQGMEDAARELDPNRTAGERFGEAVEDMGQNIQDAAE